MEEKSKENVKNWNFLTRTYKIRRPIPGRRSVEVMLPYEVIERNARRVGITADEFIKDYVAIAHYDGAEGVLYTFERKE